MDQSRIRKESASGGPAQQSASTVQPAPDVTIDRTIPTDPQSAVVQVDLWQVSVFLVASLGIFVRWWDLGWRPLQPAEAMLALESLSIVMGEAAEIDVSSLLLNGNALMMLMFGASDGVVRALPALAGSLLVLLPLWLKPQLGKSGTLMTMVFLAISPTLIFATRHNTPEVLTAAAGLTVVVCATRYMDRRNSSAIYVGAVAFALLMASGYPAYTYLIAFAPFVATRYLARSLTRPATDASAAEEESPANPEPSGPREIVSDRRILARAGLLAGAVFAIVSTAALTNLRVIQAGLAGPLAEWLSGFGSTNLTRMGTQLAILVSYEGVLLVAALMGAVLFLRDGNRFGRLLVWWLIAGTLIGVIGGAGQSLALVAGLVPAALLAGSAAGRLLDRLQGAGQLTNLIAVALGLIILSVPGYVSITFTSYVANNAGQRTLALGFLISIVIAIIIGFTLSVFLHGFDVTSRSFAGAGLVAGLKITLRSFAVAGLVAGLLFTFRVATNLNLHPNANPNELLTPAVTSPDVRRLMYDFGVLVDVIHINRAPRSVQIETGVGPVLRWYMRDQENVSFVSGSSGSPSIYIGDPTVAPPLGGAYVSQRYRIASSGQLRITRPDELTRWLMFRESSTAPTNKDVVVYAKTQ